MRKALYFARIVIPLFLLLVVAIFFLVAIAAAGGAFAMKIFDWVYGR